MMRSVVEQNQLLCCLSLCLQCPTNRKRGREATQPESAVPNTFETSTHFVKFKPLVSFYSLGRDRMETLRSLWYRYRDGGDSSPRVHDPDKRCNRCRDWWEVSIFMRYQYEMENLGPLREMAASRESPDCPMCRVVIRRLSREARLLSEGKKYLTRSTSDDHITLTCYTRVPGPPPELGIHHGNYIKGILSRWDGRDPPDARFLAGNGRIDAGQVLGWIKKCQTDHPKTCMLDRPREGPENAIELILVDVRDARLVTAVANRVPPYVALSYVWGGVVSLRTTLANLAHLKQKGALRSRDRDLAPVLRDAMLLVLNLGLRHLWVDTLCVVQDDYDKKASMLANMGRIYSRAVLTLVAACGSDASAGLVGVTANSRPPILTLTTPYQHVDLLGRPPTLADMLKTSRYETRGWTLQERLLSTRCLYFSEQQMYFQCQASIWQEDGFDGGSVSTVNPLQLSPPPAQTPRRYQLFETYMFLVKLYSQRRLTYESDALDAFEGMADALGSRWGCSLFACGIPDAILDLGLLWRPTVHEPIRRRQGSQGAELSAEHTWRHFPSWCWSGWSGPVTFLLDDERNGTVYSRAWGISDKLDVKFIPNWTPGSKPFRPVIRNVRLCSGGRVARPIQRGEITTTESVAELPAAPLDPVLPPLACDMLLFTGPCVSVDDAAFLLGPSNSLAIFEFHLRTKVDGLTCGAFCPNIPSKHGSQQPQGSEPPSDDGSHVTVGRRSFVLIGMVERETYSQDARAWDFMKEQLSRDVYESVFGVFLLVEGRGGYVERLGIGLVTLKAWEASIPVDETILLA